MKHPLPCAPQSINLLKALVVLDEPGDTELHKAFMKHKRQVAKAAKKRKHK
jgi:hypothetical protein